MRRGFALILVVGVLGVLAVLGSAFTVLSRMERRAAQQRILATQALLLARSGLEDAQARLDLWQDSEFGGEDWNNDRVLNAGPETAGQVHRAAYLDRDGCPAAQALRPSFFKAVGTNPRLVSLNGRPRGLSGAISSERAQYSLRVLSGGFHVNDANPQLRRILGTLAEALDREDGADDGSPVDQGEGEDLVDLRPPGGWASEEEIRDLALGGSRAKAEALFPYLTLAAWVDRKVIAPNTTFVGTTYPASLEVIKQGHSVTTPGSRAPGLQPRAPVDLAWARTRRPVLIALMAGLRGVWIDEAQSPGLGARLDATVALNWAAPSDDCRVAADRILASTSELGTWQQVEALFDTLPLTGTTDQRSAKRDVLKANFNPNSDLNKFNPDVSMAKRVDKSDLLVHSTELSLCRMAGERLSCTGRVVDREGRVLASRTLGARRAPDRALRLTTQAEFAAGSLGSLERAGDESLFRAYGNAAYITASRGDTKTFGHGFLGTLGSSLQTGPEPHTVAVPASYDGQLRLATVEMADTDVPAGTTLMFLARFDDAFHADHTGGGGSLLARTFGGQPLLPARPLWADTQPGTLYPDGCYSEGNALRAPGFQSLGNMAAHRGTISFWMKPDYDMSRTGGFVQRGHVYFNNSRSMFGVTAMFCLLHASVGDIVFVQKCFCQYWESAGGLDANHEQYARTGNGTPCEPHRWYLLTFTWDMDQLTDGYNAADLVDRGLPLNPFDRSIPETYGEVGYAAPTVDFRYADGMSGTSAVFYLGPVGSVPPFEGNSIRSWAPAQATLDELAIYDLGAMATAGPSATTIAETQVALRRFEAGRYYKESAYPASGGLLQAPSALRSAGEWFSAPADLGDARLVRLAWTQVVPRGLRSPVPAGWPSPADPLKREDGDPGPDGRVVMELADPAVQVPALPGAAYALDSGGAEIGSLFLRPSGERVGRRVRGGLRLHAVFQPNLDEGQKQNRAILDPLVLDDVTLTYRDPAQTGFGSWREGE